MEKIPSALRDNLRTFETDVARYLNDHRWTDEDMAGERIDCAINIIFLAGTADYQYTAQVFVGSRRPVYIGNDRSSRETALIRILDEKWEFQYVPNRPLYHDDYQFDPFADVLDFYAYLILGFDLDTYVELSGTPYFQKALNIANQALASSTASSWKQQAGSYSRFGFVDELMDLKNQPFRVAFHTYHFSGMDLLFDNPQGALDNILSALTSIAELRDRQNPRSVLVRTFFDCKYMEIAEIFLQYPNRSVYAQLAVLDPSHQSTYLEYSTK
jgi:hypothetical protein